MMQEDKSMEWSIPKRTLQVVKEVIQKSQYFSAERRIDRHLQRTEKADSSIVREFVVTKMIRSEVIHNRLEGYCSTQFYHINL